MRSPLPLPLLFLTLLLAPAHAAEGPTVPEGFAINTFATGLGKVRFLAVEPRTGVLFASITGADKVVALPDTDGDGVADRVVDFVTGLDRAHGLAFYQDKLYIAGTDRIVWVEDKDHDLRPDAAPQKIADLPGGGGHFTRTIAFGPDGKLYCSIGSTCNVCVEQNRERAAIVQMNPDGSARRLYAQGLRNAVGLAFDAAGELWATNNGRDWLGNELPPECVYRVVDEGFYGWPYAYGNAVPDPDYGGECRDCVADTLPPDWELPAHTAPLGAAFYDGSVWPASYRGDLFIALHGSWNSSYKKGYKVVRLDFEEGRPVRATDFVTGFLQNRESVTGRPVDLCVSADGQMYLTDDFGGKIFRIAHTG